VPIHRVPQDWNLPPKWKEAALALLLKEGKPPGRPLSYRPICLLDETAKLFERVIAQRFIQHLSKGESSGMGLSSDQYGFRERRSTIDAILRV
jgi:hypothetical protein